MIKTASKFAISTAIFGAIGLGMINAMIQQDGISVAMALSMFFCGGVIHEAS